MDPHVEGHTVPPDAVPVPETPVAATEEAAAQTPDKPPAAPPDEPPAPPVTPKRSYSIGYDVVVDGKTIDRIKIHVEAESEAIAFDTAKAQTVAAQQRAVEDDEPVPEFRYNGIITVG